MTIIYLVLDEYKCVCVGGGGGMTEGPRPHGHIFEKLVKKMQYNSK
jgi:hypothetical protein